MQNNMRFFVMVAAAVSLASAHPLQAKRAAVNCPATDKASSALKSSSLAGGFATCSYPTAGDCTYFTDGTFSSGGSTCPAGVAQDAAAAAVAPASTPVSAATTGSIDPNINCPAQDKDGSSLTASSVNSDNSFVTCVYPKAGQCTYFFANGSFSSGSSECPQGDANTVVTSATQALAPPATTTPAAPPPPATTSTTSTAAPPPPATTASSTSVSTVAETTPPALPTTPATTDAAVPAAPTQQSSSTTVVLTTVFVDPTDTPSSVANPEGGLSGGAGRARAAPAAVALLAGAVVAFFGLL